MRDMMRLAGTLLRIPMAVLGGVVDRLLGPDELKDCTWPSTTPPGEDDLELPGWRKAAMGDAKDALACGDNSAAWCALNRHEENHSCIACADDLPEEYNGFKIIESDLPEPFALVIVRSGTGWGD